MIFIEISKTSKLVLKAWTNKGVSFKNIDELKKYGTVTVDSDMCIICVVGDLDWSNVGFETLATDAMKNIPVRMISYGGSNYNISFLIREADTKRALQSLSDTLFN